MAEMIELYNDSAIVNVDYPAGILMCDHYTEKYGYGAYRPNGGQDWLITLTLSGKGEYRTKHNRFYCSAGDVILLRPGVSHWYGTPKGEIWDFLWVHFIPRPHWIELLQLPEEEPGVHIFKSAQPEQFERLKTAFQKLLIESHGYGMFRKALMLHALEEVLLILAQILQTENKLDSRVEEVLRLFSENLHLEHRIHDLARQLALSPSRLGHLFKQQVGDSITSTLIKMRLTKAERLLTLSDRTIVEIARDVGFKTPFYFTKQFKQFYGMNPSEYRKKTSPPPP